MPQKKRSRGISATHGVPIALLAASLLLISVSTKSILRFPGAIVSTLTSGTQYIFSSVGGFIKQTIFSIRELADLRNQYDALADKLKGYETLERDFADMMAENARLKEQLVFAQNMTTIKAASRIIANDPGNIFSSYIIDKGLSSGLAKNMAVAAFQNGVEGLAGKILDIRKNSSIVIPLFDQRFFVSARLSRTRAEGLVNGQGNSDDPLVMRYVSKINASEIQVGDMVVTSGLDSIYPADLAIGRVKEVQLPEYSSSAIILLEPSLNFSKLEYLFVLQKSDETDSDGAPSPDLKSEGRR